MRKIIVLGGAGFIGTNLCLSALRKGISVVLFDNFLRKGTDSNLDFIQKSGFGQLEVVRGDIRSIKDLEKLFEKHSDADIIFHLAGQVAVTESVRNPREDFEINALGTLNVLEVMREKGIKGLLLYASTNKVFGNLKGLEVVEEKTRYKLKDYPKCGVDEKSVYRN